MTRKGLSHTGKALFASQWPDSVQQGASSSSCHKQKVTLFCPRIRMGVSPRLPRTPVNWPAMKETQNYVTFPGEDRGSAKSMHKSLSLKGLLSGWGPWRFPESPVLIRGGSHLSGFTTSGCGGWAGGFRREEPGQG